MKRLCPDVDPRVGGGVVLFVDQPTMFAVQAVFCGEHSVTAIVVPGEVVGFESVAIADVVRELLL